MSKQELWTVFKALWAKVIGRKFVRDVGVLTIANLLGAPLSFLQGILVARWLGPELYGIAALVMSYPGLIYTFFDARSAEASVKYLSEFHAAGDRESALAMCKLGYIIDLAIATLAFLVVLVTASWAAQAVADQAESTGLIVVYAAAFIPQALVGTSQAVITTLGKFPLLAGIDSLIKILRVLLVLGLVLANWQVAGVIWGSAIATGVTGLLYGIMGWGLIYCHWGALPLQGKWQNLKGRRREIFSFLFYNELNALLGMIPKQLDVLLLGYFRNPTEVGYYKLAKSLSNLVNYLVKPLQSVTYPELARLWSLGDRQALLQRVQRLAFRVGIPLAVTVMASTCLIPWVLPSLLGTAYLPAVTATQLFFIGSAIWLAFFWLRPLFLAMGEMRFWVSNSAVVVTLTVLGFAVAIPTWGYLGLAWVWLIVGGVGGHLFATVYFLHTWKTTNGYSEESK
ncbi:lipopolysaccharide biosynthesis protein [Coleofasciculus sp.]|uniref:lipopolysaccharide biosynthesis protein n=1 Tax=Coleofasciculus sp. TaxID=3100458 RepID=UPI003A4B84FC